MEWTKITARRREAFGFCDLVHLILEVWQYIGSDLNYSQRANRFYPCLWVSSSLIDQLPINVAAMAVTVCSPTHHVTQYAPWVRSSLAACHNKFSTMKPLSNCHKFYFTTFMSNLFVCLIFWWAVWSYKIIMVLVMLKKCTMNKIDICDPTVFSSCVLYNSLTNSLCSLMQFDVEQLGCQWGTFDPPPDSFLGAFHQIKIFILAPILMCLV